MCIRDRREILLANKYRWVSVGNRKRLFFIKGHFYTPLAKSRSQNPEKRDLLLARPTSRVLASRPAGQPAGLPAGQLAGWRRPASRPAGRPASRPAGRPAGRSAGFGGPGAGPGPPPGFGHRRWKTFTRKPSLENRHRAERSGGHFGQNLSKVGLLSQTDATSSSGAPFSLGNHRSDLQKLLPGSGS